MAPVFENDSLKSHYDTQQHQQNDNYYWLEDSILAHFSLQHKNIGNFQLFCHFIIAKKKKMFR